MINGTVRRSTLLAEPDRQVGGGRQKVMLALVAIYLGGFHLRLSLYSGGGVLLIPMYPMLLAGALLVLLQANRLLARVGLVMLALAAFLLIQPFMAFAPASGSLDNLMTGMQLVASVVSAAAVIYSASTLPAESLRKLFLAAWLLLMILAASETFGLQALFRSVQEALYASGNRGVYSGDVRDVALYGKVRPAAFASEPSFLADSWMSMAVLTFLLDRRRGCVGSWGRLSLMVAIGFALAPSVKLAFYLGGLFLWTLWPRTRRRKVLLLAGIPVVVTMAAAVAGDTSSGLLSKFGSSETGSYFARITVAPYIAEQALADYPFLGYGVGNVEGLTPLISSVWQDTGGFELFPWYRGLAGEDLLSNGFWWQWLYLGLIGGIAFTVLFLLLLYNLGVESPMRVVTCTWVVWYSGYAFIDSASWFIVAVFAIPALAESRRELILRKVDDQVDIDARRRSGDSG